MNTALSRHEGPIRVLDIDRAIATCRPESTAPLPSDRSEDRVSRHWHVNLRTATRIAPDVRAAGAARERGHGTPSLGARRGIARLGSAIVSYQICHTKAGADVHVVTGANQEVDLPALTQWLTDGLHRAGLDEPEVRVTIDDSLEHHAPSGKLRRFVPLTRRV